MVDPTSDHMEDVDEDDASDCEVCGTSIVEDPDHRVVTWVEEGDLHAVHFCSPDCADEWDRPAE